jgi:predicted RNA binding protein YcfA (HicA-like mRNA interferase family)
MSKTFKTLLKILSGKSDNSIDFNDFLNLLRNIGFDMRIKGSHHILFKDGISEIINIQPDKNHKAKPYQVKQVRNIIIKYQLGDFDYE